MHRDILLTNREAVIRWIDAVVGTLGEIRQTLASDDEHLGVTRRILFRSPGRARRVGHPDHSRRRAAAGDRCRAAPGERVRSHGPDVSRRIRQAAAHAAETRRLVTSGSQPMNASDPGERSSRVEREVLEILERASASQSPVENVQATVRRQSAWARARLAKGVFQPSRLRNGHRDCQDWRRPPPRDRGGIDRRRVPVLGAILGDCERDRLLLAVGTIASRARHCTTRWRGQDLREGDDPPGFDLEGFRPRRGPKGPSGDLPPFDSTRQPRREFRGANLISDAVDAYVVRRLNARLQFLLLQRRADAPFGSSWQAIHARVTPEENSSHCGRTGPCGDHGLAARTVYSADYVNQIFDHARDAIVLIPVFAFEVEPQARIDPGPDFLGYEWCERDEATARLLWAGQRWSVRQEGGGGGGDSTHQLDPRRKHQITTTSDVRPIRAVLEGGSHQTTIVSDLKPTGTAALGQGGPGGGPRPPPTTPPPRRPPWGAGA